MSLLRYTKRPVCPPDKWRYRFPQDGHTIISFDSDGWERGILKHYRDNGYPLPEDWLAQAEDQMCRLLPAGFCEYGDGNIPKQFINRRINLNDVVDGTQPFVSYVKQAAQDIVNLAKMGVSATAVGVEFLKQGSPLVSQEVAEARGRTCAACYAMDVIPGCGSCAGIANLVAEVSGSSTTSADAILEGKACLVCRCSAKANIWIPVEVSKAGVSADMMELWPPFCWKGQELRALG